MEAINTRDIVLSILLDIENNDVFSNVALSKALRQNQFAQKSERAFITRLAEGVVERQITLDYIIDCFSKTKVRKCKPLIRCLLRMGVYQIMYMDKVPDSAATNETVKLAKKHGFASLSGFINGVLRSVIRNKDNIKFPTVEENRVYALSVKYSIPEWIVQKLIDCHADKADKIFEACFAERGTTIRVNETKISKSGLITLLKEKGIRVSEGYYDAKALIIEEYDFIRKVPGYKQGYFSVQDESSMCAIRAAGIKEGDVVLDMCAAPGGKTTLAAEYLNNTGCVYSMDISEEKLSLIEENVERLGLCNVNISAHDATMPLDIMADVVIADVPCSGLGIIGRKNDIKYKLKPEGIDELIGIQRRILDNASRHVKKGGTLLYSTCTINSDENRKNVDAFLEKNKDFELILDRAFIQGVDKCDGFYYAVLRH